ncbi:MAG TPA: PASTA domain-containing protein, partial [Mycobacterium sp.]|nr:PASTA domain-containing protein [Mycobacterium sp.]
DLSGMFWTDAEPQLRALGWTGVLIKGADVDAGGAAHNRVVYQSPAPGQNVNKDGNITLKFGQ